MFDFWFDEGIYRTGNIAVARRQQQLHRIAEGRKPLPPLEAAEEDDVRHLSACPGVRQGSLYPGKTQIHDQRDISNGDPSASVFASNLSRF